MIPAQAAKILQRDVSHVRLLCRQGKIKHKIIPTHSGNSYTYDISVEEVQRVRNLLPGKGHHYKGARS
jgi:hypothetical protein